MLDLEQNLTSGLCGIMIHHQRMNEIAFQFLDLLLMTLTRSSDIRVVNFRDLLNLTRLHLAVTSHVQIKSLRTDGDTLTESYDQDSVRINLSPGSSGGSALAEVL